MFFPTSFLLRPFTPATLSPRVWIDARNRTGNTPVTAITNAGSDGGTPSIVGTINVGTSLGGMPTLRIDDISKMITLTRPAHGTSGVLSLFWYGALIAGGGNQGFIGMNWPAGSPSVACYLTVAAGSIFGLANGLPFDSSHGPAWSRANIISDTAEHAFYTELSANNNLYLDKVSQSLATNFTGAAPNYASQSWNFGSANTTTETVNADCGAWLIFDYGLTVDQITSLSNFYLNM